MKCTSTLQADFRLRCLCADFTRGWWQASVFVVNFQPLLKLRISMLQLESIRLVPLQEMCLIVGQCLDVGVCLAVDETSSRPWLVDRWRFGDGLRGDDGCWLDPLPRCALVEGSWLVLLSRAVRLGVRRTTGGVFCLDEPAGGDGGRSGRAARRGLRRSC